MKAKLQVFYYIESERALLKLNNNNYMYSDFDNHNFTNTLQVWLAKNGFSLETIDYIRNEWDSRDIFEILGEFFEVEITYPHYYEFYDRRCMDYENKHNPKECLREKYDKWMEKSAKNYRRKRKSIKVA